MTDPLTAITLSAEKALDIMAELVEKMSAENERLRAALRGLVGAVADHTSQRTIPDALKEARAALGGDQ